MTLLRVSDLSLAIHESKILNRISFAIDAGEVLGMIGESGSGKSMTAYSVMRLCPVGSVLTGDVSLDDGVNLLTLSERQMCGVRGNDIGMIFQEPMTALNPVQTIGAQVAEAAKVHHGVGKTEALEIAARMLERVELPVAEFPLDRYPHELSGGQRQRVVIAMAIAQRPRLLIADEPTTALDVTTQAQILELLKKLVVEDDLGLILISHDLAVVANTADSIAIMRQGEVLDSGPGHEVLGVKRHPYTRELLRASRHVPVRRPFNSGEEPLLQLKSVCRDYPLARKNWLAGRRSFRAVDQVSFELFKGEKLGLVGESGCGKSTLTRAILGLEKCQQGSICIDGGYVTADRRMSKALRRKMQVVFQDPYGSFNPRHQVERLVTEPFHLLRTPPRGQHRTRLVSEVLESVGLQSSDTGKYIHEFSGGQRQRIAIARALIIRPELIILDEAVSALDVSIRAQILDLLAELSDRHQLAYLFISHDLSVVRSVTDRVLVMKDGKIVESGTTEAVFCHPVQSYTQELISSVPVLNLSAG